VPRARRRNLVCAVASGPSSAHPSTLFVLGAYLAQTPGAWESMPIDTRAEDCVTRALREEIDAQEEVGRVLCAERLPVRELWDQVVGVWYSRSWYSRHFRGWDNFFRHSWSDLLRVTRNWRRKRLSQCCWAAWKLSWHRFQLRKWLAATTRRTAAATEFDGGGREASA
jgi:hypothetical protein